MKSILFPVAVTLLFVAQSAMPESTGSIQGNVTDSSGAAILGAVVTLESPDGISRTTVTDAEGTFQISSLPPAGYSVKISASGLADWTASNVQPSVAPESAPLKAVMQVAPSVTTVTVGLSPEELAGEQLKHETQQRIIGVIQLFRRIQE